VAQQSAYTVRREVALFAGVDHQRAPPRPPEHQRGAQPGGARADNDAFPGRIHNARIAHPGPA
jgi:hypothetical protein